MKRCMRVDRIWTRICTLFNNTLRVLVWINMATMQIFHFISKNDQDYTNLFLPGETVAGIDN